MSKLVLFNKVELVDSISKASEVVIKEGNCCLVAFKKYNVNDDIFYKSSQGWVVAVGTFIYQGVANETALKRIFDDFENENSIAYLKKNIKGIYTICIFKNSCFYIFNDYYGLYNTLYKEGKSFYVCNNISDICLLDNNIKINEFPFYLHCFAAGNPSGESILSGIGKLLGTEYLVSDGDALKKKELERHSYHLNIPKYENTNQALDYLKNEIVKAVSDIVHCYGKPALSITGGLDSRLIMSSLTHDKTDNLSKLLYGESKSFHLYTCEEDKEVAKELSKISSVPLDIFDWTSPESVNGLDMKWQKVLFDKLGFLNYEYCGNRKFIETITRKDDFAFLEFGYFLESIRLREWLEASSDSVFSMSEYFNSTYRFIDVLQYEKKEELKKWLENLFISKTKYLEIQDYDRIPKKFASEIEWAFRERITDSAMHQLMNYYIYSFPIFSIPQIHEFVIKLPTDVIEKAKFQIKLIQQLNPDLLKATVFSHRRKYRINQKGEKILRYNWKNVLTTMGGYMPRIYNYLLPYYQKIVYHNSPQDNSKFLEELKEIKGDIFNNINFDDYKGDISKFFTLRQFLLALRFSSQNNREENK